MNLRFFSSCVENVIVVVVVGYLVLFRNTIRFSLRVLSFAFFSSLDLFSSSARLETDSMGFLYLFLLLFFFMK